MFLDCCADSPRPSFLSDAAQPTIRFLIFFLLFPKRFPTTARLLSTRARLGPIFLPRSARLRETDFPSYRRTRILFCVHGRCQSFRVRSFFPHVFPLVVDTLPIPSMRRLPSDVPLVPFLTEGREVSSDEDFSPHELFSPSIAASCSIFFFFFFRDAFNPIG